MPMIVAGLVLAALAALVHVMIFVMESIAWTSARTRAVFGMSQAQAAATKELAFNQGFYNLFLAVMVLLGIGLYALGQVVAGATLVLAGTGAMAAAAAVLLLSSPQRFSAALQQGVLPFLGALLVAAGLLAGAG